MKHHDALTYAGTRLAFHTHDLGKQSPDLFGGVAFVEETSRLNREAASALGEPCLLAYDETLKLLRRNA